MAVHTRYIAASFGTPAVAISILLVVLADMISG
jgi:hypothetical protein